MVLSQKHIVDGREVAYFPYSRSTSNPSKKALRYRIKMKISREESYLLRVYLPHVIRANY
jgi:hypothetical protein